MRSASWYPNIISTTSSQKLIEDEIEDLFVCLDLERKPRIGMTVNDDMSALKYIKKYTETESRRRY